MVEFVAQNIDMNPSIKSGTPAKGAFTISLDFELMWGVFDKRSVSEYAQNIDGTREAISKMLGLFSEFDIGVTWATVGLLLCKDRTEMLDRIRASGLNEARPDVVTYIKESVGDSHKTDPYHFGCDIVPEILSTARQELASHSFSHYGVQEPYSSEEGFRADIKAMVGLFADIEQSLDSHVFARNQMAEEYIRVIAENGFKAYRGLPLHQLYASQAPSELNRSVRIKRLFDSYIPLADLSAKALLKTSTLLDATGSRFLRPWRPKVGIIQPLQVKRIKSEMSHAASSGGFYHLWWHPHNFGITVDEQIKLLRQLLLHYASLKAQYGWQNRNMTELADDFRAQIA